MSVVVVCRLLVLSMYDFTERQGYRCLRLTIVYQHLNDALGPQIHCLPFPNSKRKAKRAQSMFLPHILQTYGIPLEYYVDLTII